MTEITSYKDALRGVITDPLLLRAARRLMTPAGIRKNRIGNALMVLTGVLDGLALLVLLPLASSLNYRWLIALAGLAVAGAIARYAAVVYGYSSAMDMLVTGNVTIGNKIATLPLGWFTKVRAAMFSQLVTEKYMRAAETLAHTSGTVFNHAAIIVVIWVGAWFWTPVFGAALTVAIVAIVGLMMVSQIITRRSAEQAGPAETEFTARVVEYAQNQPALRVAGRSADYAPLADALAADYRARLKDLWRQIGAMIINGLGVQLFVVVLVVGAATFAADGRIDAVQTVAIIVLTLRATDSLSQVGGMIVGSDSARSAYAMSDEILSTPSLPEPAESAPIVTPGEVACAQVTFGYDPAHPVLRDVTFTAAPGTVTAIVGPSGSGKTTLARLICRFWDVDSGQVSVGGVDIRRQSTEQLMGQLSMVFQDVYLFDTTLVENIRVGRADATDEEVRAAAQLAGVTQIAERLGWDSPVGEGGRSLSGGERQRVSVARALLKKAPIVLFDEATSALDAENEANIVAAMNSLKAQSTFLVIAHKLATVRDADQILVLDEAGRINQRGTHEELYAIEDGLYRRFWDRRAAAQGWRLR